MDERFGRVKSCGGLSPVRVREPRRASLAAKCSYCSRSSLICSFYTARSFCATAFCSEVSLSYASRFAASDSIGLGKWLTAKLRLSLA